MDRLTLPYITAGIGALFIGAVVARWGKGAAAPRRTGLIAGLASLAFFLPAEIEVSHAVSTRLHDPLLPVLAADALGSIPMVFLAALTVISLLMAPRRDMEGAKVSGMLLLSAGSQMAYAATGLGVMAAAWWMTCLPFVLGLFGKDPAQRSVRSFLLVSCLPLTAAWALPHVMGGDNPSALALPVLGLALLAVVIRKGLFPLHGWVVASFRHGPLLPAALLFNAHLGAVLVARARAMAPPDVLRPALDLLFAAAVATALAAGMRAFAGREPRRIMAHLFISQSAFVLTGLATTGDEGLAGALLHWLVVAAASTALVGVVRGLEARVDAVLDPKGHLGLGLKAPRLATFFVLCGLALVGLPGTLGYCAEDLLFHGAMESHAVLGIALPLVTALNAINLMRLFGILFLGVLPKHVPGIRDALPRERWGLLLCTAFLIVGGLFPRVPVHWRARAVETMKVQVPPIDTKLPSGR